MTYSISAWNLINSMKQVDKWTQTIQSNINGATRIGYKQFDIYYGGGPTTTIEQSSLVANGKAIAETFYNVGNTQIDFSQGGLIPSDKWFHLAIDGEGFFMTTKRLTSPLPEDIQYTRDGEFYIDGDGLLRTKESLYVLDGTMIPGDPNPSVTSVPPWNGSIFNNWQQRESLLIKNTFADTLTADTVVELTIDTQGMIGGGSAQPDLDDLRIGYWDGSTWSEIPREIVASTINTPNTAVRFRLLNDVPPNTNVVGEYYLFYDNPGATAPAGPPANKQIGLTDPDGVLDNYSGPFNPQTDPAGTNSVEDWLNASGPDSWIAGPLSSPSPSWSGLPAGNINYVKGSGYTIEGAAISSSPSPINVYKRQVIDGVSNYPIGAADGVGAVRPGGWQFIDSTGNEIVMKVINGTNTVNGGIVDYDFSLDRTHLNTAEDNLDPAKTKYTTFQPKDIYTSPYTVGTLPDLTAAATTSYDETNNGWGLNPLSGTYSPFVSAPGVVPGDSNFDANDTVWSGTGGAGSSITITESFGGGSTDWTTEFGSLTITSNQYMNTLTANNVGNDSKAYFDAGIFDDFEIETEFNRLSGNVSGDFAGIQIRKTNLDDDFFESGYTIAAELPNRIKIYKATGTGVVEVASENLSAYVASNKKMKIVADGNNIKVYVDEGSGYGPTPLIDYTDTASTYMSGHIGLRTSNRSNTTTEFTVNQDFTTNPFTANVLENVTGNLVHDPVNGNVVNNSGSGNNIAVNGGDAFARVHDSISAKAPDSTSLDITGGQITMEAWVRPTSYGPYEIIINKEMSYELALDNGILQMAVETNATPGWFWTSNSGPAVPLNQWSHVAGVYDTATNQMKLYVNGVLQHTQTHSAGSTAITPSNNALTIGRRDANIDSPSYYFSGQIDEVRISDVARYTGATYTVPTSDFTTDANTRALYHFDEALGATTLLDSSGNGNHLTTERMQYYDFSSDPIGTIVLPIAGSTTYLPGTIQLDNTSAAQITNNTYSDFILEANIQEIFDGDGGGGFLFRQNTPNDNTGYAVGFYSNNLYLRRANGTNLASVPISYTTSGNIRVSANNNNIKVYYNDVLLINYTDPTPTLGPGYIVAKTINIPAADPSTWRYDNIMIHSATTTSALTNTNPSPIDQSGLGVTSMAYYEGGTYDDFSLETDITFKESSGDTSDWAGIQFRKTNPTDTWGTSGYMVYIRENGDVDLYKAGTGVLTTATGSPLSVDDTTKLKIVANGANIKVFRDGVEIINYTDASPILTNGHISYATLDSRWAFDNLKIGDYPPVASNPGQAQWLIDEFKLTTIEHPNNDFQYLLLRQPIYVGAEGVIRDNTPINLSGFVDHDVTIVIRDSTGAIAHTIYTDNNDGYNNWNGSFDPYDYLTPGTNWIEIYASHEVASPPNVPPYNENFTSATGTLNTYDPNWNVGTAGNWAFDDASNFTEVPNSFGTIIKQTINQGGWGSGPSAAGAAIFRGDSTWDDYSFEATMGILNIGFSDNDTLRTWVRVSGADAYGPTDGYFLFVNGNGMNENGLRFAGNAPATNGIIGLAKMVNGVVTVLASNTISSGGGATVNVNNASSWISSGNQFDAGGTDYWRFRIELEGNNIKVYSTNKNYDPNNPTASDPKNGTLLFDINDASFSTGYFALENISQTAWYDNISFEPSSDRKVGFKSDKNTGTGIGYASATNPTPNEIQTIDAFQTIPRYYVDSSGNVIDRFGDGTFGANQNSRMRSDIAENLIDYDPNENVGLIVDQINDVPVLNARLVQTNQNPGTEARIYTDPTGVNNGTGDGIQYLGSNRWNEFKINLNFGMNQVGSNGEVYVYARYQDSNNWIRARYNDSTKTIRLEKSVGGTVTQLGSTMPFNLPDSAVLDQGGTLTLKVEGRRYILYDGTNPLITYVDNVNPILYGGVAVGSNVGAWFDNLQVQQLLLSKVKSIGAGVIAPNGPQDILDQMYLMVFRDQQGQNGLRYDKEFGGTYFEETTASGRPRALRPGVDGAGILHTSKLETSNVDMNKQITHLAAHSDVYDTLTKQLMVYLDTIQSSLSLFR